MNGAFKRINFFKGFATTAEDWQAADRYHSEKMRMHNKYFHSPGVIDGLTVTATRDGTGLSVGPGMALDSEGHELYLPQSQELMLDLETFRAKTIYVIIDHHESPIDFRENSLDSDYAGHAFIEELPSIVITTELPDKKTKLELARIELSSDVKGVRDPEIPSKPDKNEINSLSVVRPQGAGIRLDDVATVAANRLHGLSGYLGSQGPSVSYAFIESGPSSEHRFYVASVYLTSDNTSTTHAKDHDGITWQIMSQMKNQMTIEYWLQFFNYSPDDRDVYYKVYRFN